MILAGLLVLLVVYLGLESYAYVTANAGYTFQTSACVMAPANNDPVIAYMQSEHIYYAWSHGWLGDPISFKTNSAIKTSDPCFLTQNPPWLGRLPNYTLAVMHADRPSILTLVKHDDPNPPQLQVLTINSITYRLGRFTSEPGYDILVITPLNRAVTISEAVWIAQSFSFC